jgi:hypothetical protein
MLVGIALAHQRHIGCRELGVAAISDFADWLPAMFAVHEAIETAVWAFIVIADGQPRFGSIPLLANYSGWSHSVVAAAASDTIFSTVSRP